jgi:hypothetical protein
MNSQKLSVNSVLTEALNRVVHNAAKLFKIAIPLLIVGSVLTITPIFISVPQQSYLQLTSPSGIALHLVLLVTLVMAMVGCHRFFLLNNDGIKENPFSFSGTELGFAGRWILIVICFLIAGFFYMMIASPFLQSLFSILPNYPFLASIFTSVLFFPLYVLIARFSLVLPAAATGVKGFGFGEAWELSWNNAIRLTILLGIIPFTVDVLRSLLPEIDSEFAIVADRIVWLVVGVCDIAVLSLSYQSLLKIAQQREEQFELNKAQAQQQQDSGD